MRVEPWFKLIDWQVQCMQNEIGRFIDGVAGTMPVTEIGRTKLADRITQPVAHRLKLLICSQLHLMTCNTCLAEALRLSKALCQRIPARRNHCRTRRGNARGNRPPGCRSAPSKISIAII